MDSPLLQQRLDYKYNLELPNALLKNLTLILLFFRRNICYSIDSWFWPVDQMYDAQVQSSLNFESLKRYQILFFFQRLEKLKLNNLNHIHCIQYNMLHKHYWILLYARKILISKWLAMFIYLNKFVYNLSYDRLFHKKLNDYITYVNDSIISSNFVRN